MVSSLSASPLTYIVVPIGILHFRTDRGISYIPPRPHIRQTLRFHNNRTPRKKRRNDARTAQEHSVALCSYSQWSGFTGNMRRWRDWSMVQRESGPTCLGQGSTELTRWKRTMEHVEHTATFRYLRQRSCYRLLCQGRPRSSNHYTAPRSRIFATY